MLVLTLAACGSSAAESTETTVQTVSTNQVLETTAISITLDYDEDDLIVSESSTATATITLNGDSASVDGDGVTVNGSIVTITAAGTYSISGTLNDGQIVVDTEDKETVNLILNGVNITYATSAPIYVINAEKNRSSLWLRARKTSSPMATSYQFSLMQKRPTLRRLSPTRPIFSNDDLTINGSGLLTVNANYNNGIDSDDDLKIVSGTITVNAVNDGIKGRDSIGILDGTINGHLQFVAKLIKETNDRP